MKIGLRSHWFSLAAMLMVFLIFNAPFVALAQQAEVAEAYMAAENDAKTGVNGAFWFGIGCIGGVLGVGIAYIVTPLPPASRLIGKSPEYVAAYTDTYRATGKSIQTSKAWTGCVVGTAVISVGLTLLIAVSSD